MINRWIKILSLGLLFSIWNAFADNSAILGQWKTIDDKTKQPKSIVELYEQDNKVYGKIVQLFRAPDEDQDPTCTQCTDYRKDQKIIGMVIIEGLEKKGESWSEGTILDPENGKTYDCKVWLEEGQLKVRGYLGLFFRTQTWFQVE